LAFIGCHQVRAIGVLGVYVADLAVERPMHGVDDRHWDPVRHGDHAESAVVVHDIERQTLLSALPEPVKETSYVVGLKRCRTDVAYSVRLRDLMHRGRALRARRREESDTVTALNQAGTQQADGALDIARV
jgi:hypothetical protein